MAKKRLTDELKRTALALMDERYAAVEEDFDFPSVQDRVATTMVDKYGADYAAVADYIDSNWI